MATPKIMTKSATTAQLKLLEAAYSKIFGDIAGAKWERAKIIYKLKNHVAWKQTKYKSFRGYRMAKLDLSEMSLISFAKAHENRIRLKLTNSDIKKLSQTFSYSALYHILLRIENPISVTEILKTYKNVDLGSLERTNARQPLTKVLRVQIEMTEEYIDKFDTVMIKHGMVINKAGRKLGVKDAFYALLDANLP